jgi:hypothetical protein
LIRGLISQIASTCSDFQAASIVLDESRLIAKYHQSPGTIQVSLLTEYERIEMGMHELNPYIPRWLNGWEARVKGTTR